MNPVVEICHWCIEEPSAEGDLSDLPAVSVAWRENEGGQLLGCMRVAKGGGGGVEKANVCRAEQIKSQAASKLAIPGLEDYPRCTSVAGSQSGDEDPRLMSQIFRLLLLSFPRIHLCEDAVTCRGTCQASRGAGHAAGRFHVICDRAPDHR